MQCKFQVGDKVVCVHDKFFDGDQTTLKIGSVYTIACLSVHYDERTGPDGKGVYNGIECYVKEARNVHPLAGEIGWAVNRFKPLESKAIKLFRKIAKDVTDESKVPTSRAQSKERTKEVIP